MNRSLGLLLVTGYTALGALLVLPTGCVALFSVSVGGHMPYQRWNELVFAGGVTSITATYGLWYLRPWGRLFAWWLTFVTFWLKAFSIGGAIIAPPLLQHHTVLQMLPLGLDLWVLIYLLTAPGRDAFATDGGATIR